MKLYLLPELATVLGTDIRTLRVYIKSGRLKASKIGRNYVITEQDLLEFINNNKVVVGKQDAKDTN